MSRLGNHIAVDPFCLFRKPLDIGRAVGHLAPAFTERLPSSSEIRRARSSPCFLTIASHACRCCARSFATSAPTAEGPLRGGNGRLGFDRTAIRQRGQNRAIRGILHSKRAAIARPYSLVIDPGMVEDQFTAFELQHRVSVYGSKR